MSSWIAMIAVGIFAIVLGVLNMTGNISSVHSYHRHRVREEDRPAFARLIGIGTVVLGFSLTAFGVLSRCADAFELPILLTAAKAELIVGVVIGGGISLFAMIKYNKGIF